MKKPNIRKWLDGFPLAARGIMLATREKRFVIAAVIAFLFFGTLMNLLSAGFSKFELMYYVGFGGSMQIIGDAFLGVFGWNRIFLEWLPVFLLALMQGILIGLIALLWKKKQGQNSANIQRAGIVTGLIALGAGCPTCGTTLIAPLLGAIFSSGASMVGTVSTLVTVLAIIIAVLSLRRLGEETYVIIVNERYLKKKEECEQSR
jgi:hypothetical protein